MASTVTLGFSAAIYKGFNFDVSSDEEVPIHGSGVDLALFIIRAASTKYLDSASNCTQTCSRGDPWSSSCWKQILWPIPRPSNHQDSWTTRTDSLERETEFPKFWMKLCTGITSNWLPVANRSICPQAVALTSRKEWAIAYHSDGPPSAVEMLD